jgi:DNA-binding transcriptional MerR regulator
LTGLFTIGELAADFSLSPRAIRFYEDQGLILPQRAGTQRIYTRRDRARLQLILRGKRLGFTLSDIRAFLELYDVDRTKHLQMKMMLGKTRARISELEQQLDDIVITLAELRDMEGQILAYTQSDPSAPLSAEPQKTDTQKGAGT